MGDRYQTPLGFNFLTLPEMEPAEISVVFDIPKNYLHFDIAQDVEPLPFFGEQVGLANSRKRRNRKLTDNRRLFLAWEHSGLRGQALQSAAS